MGRIDRDEQTGEEDQKNGKQLQKDYSAISIY
jgi:hypothetical protein